jgi:hypothetical protein
MQHSGTETLYTIRNIMLLLHTLTYLNYTVNVCFLIVISSIRGLGSSYWDVDMETNHAPGEQRVIELFD